jgi:hypothetical protein
MDGEFAVLVINDGSENGTTDSSTEVEPLWLRQQLLERYERTLQVIALMEDEAADLAIAALGRRLYQPLLAAARSSA